MPVFVSYPSPWHHIAVESIHVEDDVDVDVEYIDEDDVDVDEEDIDEEDVDEPVENYGRSWAVVDVKSMNH